MKFTNPNDVFTNIPMDTMGIVDFVDTLTFVNQVDLGEQTVTLNGARLKVKRVGADVRINRRLGERGNSNPLVGRNLLDKVNITQMRTQALVGGLFKYLMGETLNARVTGIKVGGDNFHRHFNNDGIGNAGYGSGYNAVSRPSNSLSYLSDKLLEVANPTLMTNLPYLQPNEVWPSTQIDTAPYPTSISSRIGTDLNLKMTSANIPGKELSELAYRTEFNNVRLNIEDFPRLDVNPNKKFGPFEHKYAIFNWDEANRVVTLAAVNRDKTTTEKIDYGILRRVFLGNFNEAKFGNAHRMQDQVVTNHAPREANKVCYPWCENFKLSNAHFRIQYNRFAKDLPDMIFQIGGGYDPFRNNRAKPGVGELGIGSNVEEGKTLPRYMCLWAIEGDNNYVEIDLDDGGGIYVNNISTDRTRHLSLVSIRGTGNVVVIRLKRELKFYGNSNSSDGAVAFWTMASNNPDKNVVYILGPKNQNISESLVFDESSIKDPMRRKLLGCIHMDLYNSYWEATQADSFKMYDKYRSDISG